MREIRPTVGDLARLAALNGVVIPPGDLERLLPSAVQLYEDLERLRALPIRGVEPAFTPEPRTAEAGDASAGREPPRLPHGSSPGVAERRDA